MDKLAEKIQKHPRSQVARAYRLGQAQSDGILPLFKLTIRYFMLRGIYKTKKEDREYAEVRESLKRLVKTK